MTLPVDPVPGPGTTGPIPGGPPIGQPDPPIKEPDPDRLPDEEPIPNPDVPNPDETTDPPQHVAPFHAMRDVT
ncbi:hypothetical protein LJR255_004235 [Pararhizobium sp. LjRoot255]